MRPVDCAWAYEFEAMVGETRKFKLADIVVHARDARANGLLLVIEVKRPFPIVWLQGRMKPVEELVT